MYIHVSRETLIHINQDPHTGNNLNVSYNWINSMDKKYSTSAFINIALNILLTRKAFNHNYNKTQLVKIIKIFKIYMNAPTVYKGVRLQSDFLPIKNNMFMIPYKSDHSGYISIIYCNLINIIDSILVKLSNSHNYKYASICYQIHDQIQMCWRNLKNINNSFFFKKYLFHAWH